MNTGSIHVSARSINVDEEDIIDLVVTEHMIYWTNGKIIQSVNIYSHYTEIVDTNIQSDIKELQWHKGLWILTLNTIIYNNNVQITDVPENAELMRICDTHIGFHVPKHYTLFNRTTKQSMYAPCPRNVNDMVLANNNMFYATTQSGSVYVSMFDQSEFTFRRCIVHNTKTSQIIYIPKYDRVYFHYGSEYLFRLC